jgi:hypothetical protein
MLRTRRSARGHGDRAPSRRGAWATFQPAQAPLGLWLQRPAAPGLLASLMRALPGIPLVFGLTQCDPMLLPRPPDGGRCARSTTSTRRIVLAGSFDDYWNARGKNLRSNLKKQRNRLDKEGVATAPGGQPRAGRRWPQAVADYGRLESAGWKAAAAPRSAGNAQGRYYRAMLEAFCRRGAGSVYRYWFGERLVAMDLCVEDGGSIVVLKTAYDESVPKSLSPTLLMREEACRACSTKAASRASNSMAG